MRTAGLAIPIRGPEAAGAVSWQGYVKDKDLTAPPGSPAEGDRYIIASPATGLWATHEDDIAEWDGAVWIFQTPAGGWAVWVQDEGEIYVFNGSSWGQESFGPHAPTHKGGGADEIDAATVSVAGLMAAADKDKLDGLSTVIRTTDDIEAILEAASDGDSFWLEDGTHTAAGLITITSKRNISIRGSRAAVITKASSDIFKIEGCHDFTMEGFTLSVLGGDYNTMVRITKAGAGSYLLPTRHHYRNLFFETTNVDSAAVDAFNIADDFLASTIECCDFNGRFYNVLLLSTEVATEYISGSSFAHNRIVVDYTDGGTCVTIVGNGNGFQVVHNYIEGPFNTGIRVNADYVEVSSNFITGSLDDGIIVSSAGDHIRVIDNVVYDAGAVGIEVSGDNALVKGNYVYSTAAEGIKLLGSSQSMVSNNVLEGNGTYGLSLDASSTTCTVGGNHFNGNTSGKENIAVEFQRPDGTFVNPLLQTTDATVTTIKTIPIPDDTNVWIEANIVNRRTNAADRGKFKRGALVYREAAGAATKEGSTWTPLTIKSVVPAVWNVDIVVSGNNALIQVTGAVGHDINWESRHTVEERS